MQDGTIYEFADFRLIPDDNLLLRNGEPVQLTPKAFATLLLLVERHGHLVRKSELIETIWADTFVEEAAISRCVWTIRNALAENSKSQRLIQTVPKSGYKFVGEVIAHTNDDLIRDGRSASVIQPLNEAGVNRSGNKWFLRQRPLLYIGLAIAAVFAMGFWYMGSLTTSAVATGTPGSLAVLPLQPIDSQNPSEIHEIGVAETLIHRLSSSRGLIVRPLSAVRKYDAIDQDPLAAGREQKVGYVLSSNYQIADGKIRVTAQLIDVSSGGVQDTYKIESSAGDIFALQDAVADKIAEKLIARFDRAASEHRVKRGTENEEAYRLYLQGKNLAMRRNPVDARKAREYLEQAVELDPGFALAYAQLARVHRRPPVAGEYGTKLADQYIDKALELDPNLAEAYVARAERALVEDWNFPAVEKDLDRALELEPNNDQAHWLSSMLSLNRGQFDEALAKIEIARSIDPGAVMYMLHRGRILYYARRFDEAVKQYKQASDLDEKSMQPYGWMARVYEVLGDDAAAYRYFINGEERSPRKDKVDIYRQIYEAKGWAGLRGSVEELKPRELIWFDLARVHALRGEKDAAFASLNKAVENREWLMITLQVEPAFDSLRDDPRFTALADRLAFERS